MVRTPDGDNSQYEQALKTYQWVSLFILMLGLLLFFNVSQTMFFGENKKTLKELSHNSVLLAWYLLLPPNVTMMLAYFIEHLSMLIQGTASMPGKLCTTVAFFAISAVVSINGSSITIAYITCRLVRDGKVPDLRIVLTGNFTSWVVGIVIAIIFMTGNSIGPYHGLYCCVKESEYHGFRVALIFATFCFSLTTQSFFYFRAWDMIQRKEQNTLQSNIRVKASRVIMRRGLEMVTIFYVCWIIICVDSIIAYVGGNPKLWTSIVGAWTAKLNPVLHCIMMHRNLRRTRKVSAIVPTSMSPASQKNLCDLEENAELKDPGMPVEEASKPSTQSLEKKIVELVEVQENMQKKIDTLSATMLSEFGSMRQVIQRGNGADTKKVKEEQLLAEIQVLRRQLTEAGAPKSDELRENLAKLQKENLKLQTEIMMLREGNASTLMPLAIVPV